MGKLMNSLPLIVQFAIGAFVGGILADVCIKYLEKGDKMNKVEKKYVKMTDLIGKDSVDLDTVYARSYVRNYINNHLDKTDEDVPFEVYVVWQCYILGHRKWIISSTLPDKMYYEVTYNNTKKEWYLDAYVKLENVCIEGNYIDKFFKEDEE